jgi:DNA-binding response OmpR family regulator
LNSATDDNGRRRAPAKGPPKHLRKLERALALCRKLARMAQTVLVVEDEPEITGLLRDFLDVAGFCVVVAGDAEEALAVLDEAPVDCALVDVMLPGASGFDLCRRVRERSQLPLLFLTARSDDSDKLRGLGLGADDYIVKSATPAEVIARVKAVLRRSPGNGRSVARPELLRFGPLCIDAAAHEVRLHDRTVQLTAREFALLRVFAEHPRQVLSRDQLFELLWGSWGHRSAVSVYVRKLREKLEDDPADPQMLVTIWGVGYRFDPVMEQ